MGPVERTCAVIVGMGAVLALTAINLWSLSHTSARCGGESVLIKSDQVRERGGA